MLLLCIFKYYAVFILKKYSSVFIKNVNSIPYRTTSQCYATLKIKIKYTQKFYLCFK